MSEKEGKHSKGVQFQFLWLVPKKDGNMKEEEVEKMVTQKRRKWNAVDGSAP
jgi:hypothetical protein